jgi:ribonucleoside-diphosphate reductase subunit M1
MTEPKSTTDEDMYVLKRDGSSEIISFDKILKRVKNLGHEFNLSIQYTQLVMKVIDQLYNNIKTSEIDELTAQQCASMASLNPDYNRLAGAIVISNLQKNTSPSFYQTMKLLSDFRDVNGKHHNLVSEDLMRVLDANHEIIDKMIDPSRDYLFDYFGFKTLERAYLTKCDKTIVERPQYMWMRVALCIHGDNLNAVRETYDLMSEKWFTHATPTLFNAGTPRPQLSSCFLLAMESDSIDGIFNTLKECAQISKWSGGIGLHAHNIRCTGSHIRGTNGVSNGLIPMLGVFNKTARYVDQGGKRNGSFAIYLEPHHPDVEDFLDLKKNHGDEENRARDLFYAMWISDLFMRRVKANAKWSLFCPDQCPDLCQIYGDEYERRYEEYERAGVWTRQINARDLWIKILDSQMETGTPYILYKDACNRKSNQKNLGTIQSSNLCSEIIEYSDDNETAVCNLASISLPAFVKADKTFDYERLVYVTGVIVNNLNNIIDINFYPNQKTRRSNFRHRPIGIGVQGLADTFLQMNLAFTSDEAKQVNRNIFETIYYGAVKRSMELSRDRRDGMNLLRENYLLDNWRFEDPDDDLSRKYTVFNTTSATSHMVTENDTNLQTLLDRHRPILAEITGLDESSGGSYSSFRGSPMSEGVFQFDMWNVEPDKERLGYDWTTLRKEVIENGIRNSLLVAPMPTASTAQILGNNECFEPLTSNIYSRRTLAGEFVIVNKNLVKDLQEINMWNEAIKNNIIANRGSVQYIDGLPDELRERYKIVWEMPMRDIIDMARDRGAFICQSQSLNLWVEDPDPKILTNIHFYSWQAGLKTGMYYLRRKPKHQPQQFTIEISTENKSSQDAQDCLMCSG